jgi:hypothetical protein
VVHGSDRQPQPPQQWRPKRTSLTPRFPFLGIGEYRHGAYVSAGRFQRLASQSRALVEHCQPFLHQSWFRLRYQPQRRALLGRHVRLLSLPGGWIPTFSSPQSKNSTYAATTTTVHVGIHNRGLFRDCWGAMLLAGDVASGRCCLLAFCISA